MHVSGRSGSGEAILLNIPSDLTLVKTGHDKRIQVISTRDQPFFLASLAMTPIYELLANLYF